MERLTKRINDVVTYIGTKNEYDTGMIAAETASSVAAVREILLRLAAYEDTGLTPEEVTCIQKCANEDKALTKCPECLDDRLRELAEADKDGRLVVLPCKVGDTVYYLDRGKNIEAKVISYTVDETGAWMFTVEIYDQKADKSYYCAMETAKIGKTVSLTREEAERAMEGRKDG